MPGQERAGLREVLDAVLDDDNRTSEEMVGVAYSFPCHFSRQLARGAWEPPVGLRRRVLWERAAWQLDLGTWMTGGGHWHGVRLSVQCHR